MVGTRASPVPGPTAEDPAAATTVPTPVALGSGGGRRRDHRAARPRAAPRGRLVPAHLGAPGDGSGRRRRRTAARLGHRVPPPGRRAVALAPARRPRAVAPLRRRPARARAQRRRGGGPVARPRHRPGGRPAAPAPRPRRRVAVGAVAGRGRSWGAPSSPPSTSPASPWRRLAGDRAAGHPTPPEASRPSRTSGARACPRLGAPCAVRPFYRAPRSVRRAPPRASRAGTWCAGTVGVVRATCLGKGRRGNGRCLGGDPGRGGGRWIGPADARRRARCT